MSQAYIAFKIALFQNWNMLGVSVQAEPRALLVLFIRAVCDGAVPEFWVQPLDRFLHDAYVSCQEGAAIRVGFWENIALTISAGGQKRKSNLDNSLFELHVHVVAKLVIELWVVVVDRKATGEVLAGLDLVRKTVDWTSAEVSQVKLPSRGHRATEGDNCSESFAYRYWTSQ